jgi:hypothetical protein
MRPSDLRLVSAARDRDAVVADLIAGLHALGEHGDVLTNREPILADISTVDALLRGVSRCLSELRISLDPPRTVA